LVRKQCIAKAIDIRELPSEFRKPKIEKNLLKSHKIQEYQGRVRDGKRRELRFEKRRSSGKKKRCGRNSMRRFRRGVDQ